MSFTRFLGQDIVTQTQKVVTSTWDNNTNALTAAETSSLQAVFTSPTSSGAHFLDIHFDTTTSSVQYSIAYVHKAGSGSLDFTNAVGSKGRSPSRNIYSQYRQLVFGDETQNFNFTDFTPDDIYVININRSRYKHNLKPGSLNLTLSGSGAGGSGVTGKITLTDDSITTTGSATITNAGRQFNIVSGSSGVRLGANTVQVTNSGSYGFFYPDSGFIVLNPAALKHHINVANPGTSANTADNNHVKLMTAISGGASFIVDSEEKIASSFYFARARNFEFNYSTNPSFTDNSGNVLINSMIDNPTSYITTVGLYNDEGDLLAVAKLSQPITKDFTKEALIRVKLDY